MSARWLCGIDEAGRGPLAGPVYAAAVVLGAKGEAIEGIDDSKKLSAATRESLAALIQRDALAWAVCSVDVATIDRINILQATLQGMFDAVKSLVDSAKPPIALAQIVIDGTQIPRALKPWCEQRAIEVIALPRADATVKAVAAASILAKTARDAYMIALDRDYPQYGFASHKGYGSAKHMAAIEAHGPCPHHRMSFAPMSQRGLF
ncbi:MAG: ribonuclease HII [Betaproteobacteria bacterium]|nr:MAG: ribonuclease HII [Betaproteobacteria bacterium]